MSAKKPIHFTKAEDFHYYKYDLWKALEMAVKEPEELYTHYFRILGTSKMRDPVLCRKILRTLENIGFLTHLDKGCHIHMWKITQAGMEFYSTNKSKEYVYDISFFFPK